MIATTTLGQLLYLAEKVKQRSGTQVSKRGRLLYVSHKQSHLKYEQLNTLRDQNKNTHVVVYRRYAATFSLSTHLLDTCVYT